MNTNLILVTNVPKWVKQFDLLKELENKWARALFIDNPYVDLIDVFIYNPTSLMSHYEYGVNNLRQKLINGTKPLKVYYLWFPPPNVSLTNLIPENSTMLPFLFVDNLPKECDSFEIIGELPFKQNEVKHWDVSQKEDKWMVLRLPDNQDDSIRDYVLKYIRSRRLSNGLFPRVLEVFATEDYRLSITMIPKKIDLLPITASYKSNLMFLYDLPTKFNVRNITEAAKTLNVKGVKSFFIDVVNGLRVGFMFIPKSLSEARFKIYQEQIKEKEIVVENSSPIFLNINEIWLQPHGADVPIPFKLKADERTVEFVLTNYVFVHNVSPNIDHNLLTKGSPVNFKIFLFQMSDNATQIGFICIRGMSEDKIILLLKHLRSLTFEGYNVMVDNVYLKCYDLPEDYSERRDVHIPRKEITIEDEIGEEIITFEAYELEPETPESNGEVLEEPEDVPKNVVLPKIEIAKEPPSEFNLMKSDFLYINKLPSNIDASLFSFLNISKKAVNIMSSGQFKSALIYYPDTSASVWLQTLENIATSRINGNLVEISEVFLQSDESLELIQSALPSIKPSKYVFVYNINDCVDTRKLNEHKNIVRFSKMETDSGGCAFVELVNDLSPEETISVLNYIRSINVGGVCLCADLIWFGAVKFQQGDKDQMRSKWLKKSSDQNCKKIRLE